MVYQANHGISRELWVRELAARLGVADFVYTAPPVRKGGAQREASGDGLLIVGEHGAVLQVKARDPLKAASDSAERALSWALKNYRTALRQGRGTKRELARRHLGGRPLIVSPSRAAHLSEEVRSRYELAIAASTARWPIIVILDHPGLPAVDLGFEPDVVTFTFDDWLELQRRLRSISATIGYVHRILTAAVHVALGCEEERYAELRAADEGAIALRPLFLADPAEFDELGTDLFHDIIDKVWPHDGVIPWRSAAEYRQIVEFLDAMPPTLQSRVGRWYLKKRREVANGKPVSSGVVKVDDDRLVVACSDLQHWQRAECWQAESTLLTFVRHIQALESGAPDSTTTLGIAALVEEREGQGGVSYSFVMLSGREAVVDVPADLRQSIEDRYGVHSHRDSVTR